MNVLQRKVLKAVSKMAERETGVLGKRKVPCIGYFYQPRRPKRKYIEKFNKK